MAKKLAHIVTTLLGGKRGKRGEGLVEVLVSITISALALIMLGMAISVASNMAMSSRDYMNDYYAANTAALDGTSTSIGSGTVALTSAGSSSAVPLIRSTATMSVDYYENDEIGENGIVLYD